jgi:hypothetical protein
MPVPPDSPRTTNPYTFRSSLPDLELLRAAMDYGWKDWHYGDSLHDTDIGALDTILDAARFLLSVLDEGGRLVAEAPCEHGSAVRHRISEALPHVMCPGGSRLVVWPTDKETA